MKHSLLRKLLCIGCVLALAGCDSFGGIGDTVSGWFSSTQKSKLKGERISVMALDTSLKPDPDLQKTAVVLPRPYVNKAWPEPGGMLQTQCTTFRPPDRCANSGRATQVRVPTTIRD